MYSGDSSPQILYVIVKLSSYISLIRLLVFYTFTVNMLVKSFEWEYLEDKEVEKNKNKNENIKLQTI